jgi:hypothetical protein
VDSIVRSRFFWDPSPRWRFSLTATYTKRESATESSQIVEVVSPLGELQPGTPFPEVAIRTGELRVVQIDDAVDVDTYALHLRARRSFTRRLSAFVSLDYRRQENHGDFFGMGRETQRFRAAIGFTYGFDPIPL